MTRDEFIRQLETYLEEYEGSTPLPERVRTSVQGRIPTVPQRPGWWPDQRHPGLNAAMGIALTAAAVVVVSTLIGLGVLGGGRVGGPGAHEASPSPSPPTTELRSDAGLLEPGRYSLGSAFPAQVTFELPRGWTVCGMSAGEQGVCRIAEPMRGVGFVAVENVVVHPCDTRLMDPPADRSVEAFVAAVAGLAGFSVTEPIEVTRGDFVGQQVVVTAPADPQCPALRTWSLPGRTNVVHAGEVNILEVFDVGGHLVAVTGTYDAGQLSAAELAEIHAVMESVEIRP